MEIYEIHLDNPKAFDIVLAMNAYNIILNTGKEITVTSNLKAYAVANAIERGLMTKDDAWDVDDIVEIEQPKVVDEE